MTQVDLFGYQVNPDPFAIASSPAFPPATPNPANDAVFFNHYSLLKRYIQHIQRFHGNTALGGELDLNDAFDWQEKAALRTIGQPS